METLRKKYLATVEVTFENYAAYDTDQAAGIILTVPVGEKGLYGTCVFHRSWNKDREWSLTKQPLPIPVDFVQQLRYLEAVKASDGKSETIDSLKKEFCEKGTPNADL
jgi:hypothetical protein